MSPVCAMNHRTTAACVGAMASKVKSGARRRIDVGLVSRQRSFSMSLRKVLFGNSVLLLLLACRSEGPPNRIPPDMLPPEMMPPPPYEPPVPPPFSPYEASLHRLTLAQYQNTVRDLLGDVTVPSDLEVDTSLHGFTTVGASELTVGPRAAEQYEEAARDLASQIFSERGRAIAFVGCDPANADDPCVRDFLARFGRRTFRRPLASDELDLWQGVASR